MRTKPLPPLSPSPGYERAPFRVLAHGPDTYAETWNVDVGLDAREAIRAARLLAEEDPRGRDPVPMRFGGEDWDVMPHGAKGGVVHILAGPEMLILFRSFETEWCVTVRYRSAGIWSHGLPELRERAARFIGAIGQISDDEDNPRVTRMDYAADIHAPGFAPRYAMADWFVFPQGTAKLRMVGRLEVIGRSLKPQTFTLGRIDGLQVQLYDKCAEIREASGKDWFHQLWGGITRDVWRVEARFSGGWLKDRGLRTYEAVSDHLPELLSTALTSYRLTDGEATRARRANVHPLWWRAMEAMGNGRFGLAVDDLCTIAPREFSEMMQRQSKGLLRSALVALHGEMNQAVADTWLADVLADEQRDPNRDRAIEKLRYRHRWKDRPQ